MDAPVFFAHFVYLASWGGKWCYYNLEKTIYKYHKNAAFLSISFSTHVRSYRKTNPWLNSWGGVKVHLTFQERCNTALYLSEESPLGTAHPSYTLCFGWWTAVGISWPEESEMWPEASGETRETQRASCSNKHAIHSLHMLTNVIYKTTYTHYHRYKWPVSMRTYSLSHMQRV